MSVAALAPARRPTLKSGLRAAGIAAFVLIGNLILACGAVAAVRFFGA